MVMTTALCISVDISVFIGCVLKVLSQNRCSSEYLVMVGTLPVHWTSIFTGLVCDKVEKVREKSYE